MLFGIKKIIFSAVIALVFLLPSPIFAATLSLSPATGTYPLGSTFTATVMVGSGGVATNAFSGIITFPTDKLTVTSLSKNNSVVTYWVREPQFSNTTGRIEFEGVVPNPGFAGGVGRILTIAFRSKVVGAAPVDFTEGSVLANDGQGTNILSNLTDANYVITPVKLALPAREATTVIGAPGAPQVTSSSHPDPDAWYNNSNPVFKWELASDITGVNILADHSPSTNPGTNSDGRFATYSYQEVKDGSWYFHLRLRNAGGWGDITHFGFNIDTKPPVDLQITPVEQLDATNPVVAFLITATDLPTDGSSGLDRYEISIDGAPPEIWLDTPDHQFSSSKLKLGLHTLLVKVYDRAGNSLAGSVDFSITPLPSPRIIEYPREIVTGEVITLRGEALSHALVTLRFKHPNGEETTHGIRADATGHFVVSIDDKWPAGVYTATAVASDDRGAESLPSESINLSVYLPAFWQWGNNLLRWLSLIVPILALLILLIFLTFWSYYRVRRIKQTVRRESREAQEALHKAFDFLRDKSRDQLALLDAAKASRVLTKEEASLAESLRQSLNDVEAFVRKEIGDIERIAD